MALLEVTSDRLPWPCGSRIDSESELASPLMAARLVAGGHLALIPAGESSEPDVGAEDRPAEASENDGAGDNGVSSKAGAVAKTRRRAE